MGRGLPDGRVVTCGGCRRRGRLHALRTCPRGGLRMYYMYVHVYIFVKMLARAQMNI